MHLRNLSNEDSPSTPNLTRQGLTPYENKFQKSFFAATSQLAHTFPRVGARLLNGILQPLVGNAFLPIYFNYRNLKTLKKVKSFRRFLINPDTHIGDTIMAQAIATALRDFFPECEIDFVASIAATPLVEGNPEINRFFSLYQGGPFPSELELKSVETIIAEGNYDLCFNICPFIKGDKLAHSVPFLDFISHASQIARNETTTEINHFAFQYYQFVRSLLSQVATPLKSDSFGLRITLSDSAIESARRILEPLPATTPIVMFNPDTASPFTCIPLTYQKQLFRWLAEKNGLILVGAGHTQKGIGKALRDSLPTDLQQKIHIIAPETTLETYSALIDFSDLFVTGDTGPMHIAAAKKYSRSGKYSFRNRTAILSMFGATPPRMSGYDSHKPGYLHSNQEAPSWCFQAKSPCRNITCVNKLYKTCENIRCFEEIDLRSIENVLNSYLT